MVWRLSWDIVRLLIELQVIIVFLLDLSGGMDSIKGALRKWLRVKGEISLRPFDCSLCMTHWVGLLVLLCLGELRVETYLVVCVLALLTRVTEGLLTAALRALLWATDKLTV